MRSGSSTSLIPCLTNKDGCWRIMILLSSLKHNSVIKSVILYCMLCECRSATGCFHRWRHSSLIVMAFLCKMNPYVTLRSVSLNFSDKRIFFSWAGQAIHQTLKASGIFLNVRKIPWSQPQGALWSNACCRSGYHNSDISEMCPRLYRECLGVLLKCCSRTRVDT